jgi:hypothetical protein
MTYHQMDEAVVTAVVSVLTVEEQAMGVQQPFRIGICPHPKPIDSYFPGKFIHLGYLML